MTDNQDRIGTLQAELREIEEAQQAARQVMHRLDASDESLAYARQLGDLDAVFGGGMFSAGSSTTGSTRQTGRCAMSTRRSASCAGELADIGVEGVGEVGIGELHRTLDVWFDNIFSDAMSQSRIKDAARRVEVVGTSLVRLQGELARRTAAVSEELDRLRTEADTAPTS